VAELHLYDFDDTLFRAPEPPPRWDDASWWEYPVSMGPPCVPQNPGREWWIEPSLADARRSLENPDVFAILCTGRARKNGLQERIPELLQQQGLNFDEVHLNPGMETRDYKIQVIDNILRRSPDIDTVHIWEDNLDNLAAFCRAVEATGRTCVQHPVRSSHSEPLCSQEDLAARRVAFHYLQGARPIRINRSEVNALVDRLMDKMARWATVDPDKPLGTVRKPLAEDSILIRDMRGDDKAVVVILTSKESKAGNFVLDGGFGHFKKTERKGRPVLVVELNGKYPAGMFGESALVRQELLQIIMHELTHGSDWILPKGLPGSGSGEIPSLDDIDPKAYFNDPREVRAYMREFFERLRPRVQKVMETGLGEEWGLGGAITRLLRMDHNGNRWSPT